MSESLLERAFGGLQDLIVYEGGRLVEIGKILYFIQCNAHHVLNLRTQEDQNEFRVLIGSLTLAAQTFSQDMKTSSGKCLEGLLTTDQAVKTCISHAHRFSDDIEELSGMFLGLARRTKTIEARDFFIDLFRKLSDTADGAV